MKICKRLLACLILLGMLGTMLTMPTAAKEEKNMFQNGDFSRGMTGWQTWCQDPGGASITLSRDGGVDGTPCVKITNTKPVAASLFQFVGCKQGKRYMMTCRVRYENVGLEGSGLVLGNAAYDASSNNIGEALSTSSFGSSSEWRTISFVFEVTNNPASMNAGPRLWFSTGTVYVDDVSLVEIKKTPAESGSYELTMAETPNRHTVNALGCEWDPKMLLPVNEAHGVTEEDLVFMKGRIEELGLQAVRMMITPDWFEKTNDNDDPRVADPSGFDFDNPEMKSVFAYLKVCQELGVRVTLTWWGAPTGCWLSCENTGDWIGAPNDLDEMAENIAYLLDYIRNELKYDCVKELILQNEPSYSFKVDGGAVDFDYYVEYYKTVQKRLSDDGMGDIVLVGADDSQHYGWYFKSYNGLKDICGKFNSHNYAWSYDLPYLDVLVQEFVSARTSISEDKPFFLGEFGDGTTSGAYTAASTETFGRGIYVASVVVNAFKAGAAGASYWPLHDIYYYENLSGGDNGGLMAQGLIGFKKDGAWSYRPTYYAYGLLCNYIPYGSEIFDVKGDTNHYVDTVAVKTPEGRWSIIAVNRSDAEQTVSVKADAIGTCLRRYDFVESGLPTDGSMIGAAAHRVVPQLGTYTMTLPATSFVVLSSVDMSEEDMAVPEIETSELPPETVSPAESDTLSAGESDTAVTSSDDPSASSSTTTVGGSDKPQNDGCGSALAVGMLAASLPAAVLCLRKKRED